MFERLFLFILTLLTFCRSQVAVIRIHEPTQSAIFLTKSDKETVTATIKYTLHVVNDEELVASTKICIQVTSASTKKDLLLSCFPAKEGLTTKKLDGLYVGVFILTVTLQDKIGNNILETEERIVFHVKELADALPKIAILKTSSNDETALLNTVEGEIFLVASTPAEIAVENAIIHYSLGESELEMSNFELCVNVVELHAVNAKSQILYLPHTQREFSLHALEFGSYLLSLTWVEKNDDSTKMRTLFPATKMNANIHVHSILDEKVVPRIEINEDHHEIGLTFGSLENDFLVKCHVVGLESAVKRVQVCAQVDSVHQKSSLQSEPNDMNRIADMNEDVHKKSLMPVKCLTVGKHSFTLHGIIAGLYDIKLTLRVSTAPHDIIESSEVHMVLEARDMNEIVPSYNWQPLHPWHTIPLGIQTRCVLYCSLLYYPVLYSSYFTSISFVSLYCISLIE